MAVEFDRLWPSMSALAIAAGSVFGPGVGVVGQLLGAGEEGQGAVGAGGHEGGRVGAGGSGTVRLEAEMWEVQALSASVHLPSRRARSGLRLGLRRI